MYLTVGAEGFYPLRSEEASPSCKNRVNLTWCFLPLLPCTLPDIVQTLAESSSSHVANTFLETFRGGHWCIFTTPLPVQPGPCAAACAGSTGDLDQGLLKPAQLFAIRVVPYCRLAHLEISQILKFLTAFSRTSLLNHYPVSIITNSAAAEILTCIYYPIRGVLKMHHGPQLPFPWSTCCNVLRVCQLGQAHKVPKFSLTWSATQRSRRDVSGELHARQHLNRQVCHTPPPLDSEHPDNSGMRQATRLCGWGLSSL